MFESEEDRIVERIKEDIKSRKNLFIVGHYRIIMLRNGRILDIVDYRDMVNAGKIKPQDAYAYSRIDAALFKAIFYYPFLGWHTASEIAYFSKLGFHSGDFIVPATGLKYVAAANFYGQYLSIEVSNLDTVVNNTNLRKIVVEVLDDKLISGEKELTGEEFEKIEQMFTSQRLFAGHNVGGTWDIIRDYYDRGNQSLAKEVARIAMDYYKIFNPYRVCYDMHSWEEVDCWSIKLD